MIAREARNGSGTGISRTHKPGLRERRPGFFVRAVCGASGVETTGRLAQAAQGVSVTVAKPLP